MKKSMLIIGALLLLLTGCAEKKATEDTANSAGTKSVTTSEEKDSAKTKSASTYIANPTAAPAPSKKDEVLNITEKMFITQINDIYTNPKDYMGKYLKYEGLVDFFTDENTGNTYYSVIRYGPGCCGTDANAGFEVAWDQDYPAKNDWVEVVGILETYEEDGAEYLRLRLSSITKLETRGKETLTQ